MSDYIKRDDLLERLGIDDLDCTKCSWGYNHGFICKRGCDFQDACEAIEDAEAADVVPRELYQRALSDVVTLSVERKRGKWEDVEVTDISERTDLPLSSISSMRCSACNRYHNEVYHYGIPTEMAHFCPNCGAQMESEGE